MASTPSTHARVAPLAACANCEVQRPSSSASNRTWRLPWSNSVWTWRASRRSWIWSEVWPTCKPQPTGRAHMDEIRVHILAESDVLAARQEGRGLPDGHGLTWGELAVIGT